MRQILTTIRFRPRVALGVLATLGAGSLLSGCHIDMWAQPKVDAYEESDFFADRQASRPLVPGTRAQGALKETDPVYYTGFEPTGRRVARIPQRAVRAFASPGEMLKRGQDRYEAYCTPCHSRVGNGNGFITQRGLGYWQKLPASFHTDRLRKVEDGHIFDVITNGYGVMYGYASRVQNVDDRWALVAYVRALQLAQNADPALLTPEGRTRLQQLQAERTRLERENAELRAPTGGLRAGEGHGGGQGHEPPVPAAAPGPQGMTPAEGGVNPNQEGKPTPLVEGGIPVERPANRTPGGPAPTQPNRPGATPSDANGGERP